MLKKKKKEELKRIDFEEEDEEEPEDELELDEEEEVEEKPKKVRKSIVKEPNTDISVSELFDMVQGNLERSRQLVQHFRVKYRV